MRRLARVAAPVGVAAALFIGLAPAAQAQIYYLSGELNTGGALIQYSTFRSHINGGASLKIWDNVGTYSRFGLRNTSGTQVTNTNQYNGSGGDMPFTMTNGSSTIPTGNYALNGRMGAQSGADRFWKGDLNL